MNINQKHKYKGKWWKYDSPEVELPGILEITQNKSIKLNVDNLFPTKNGVHALPEKIGTIFGKTLRDEKVTLLGCQSFFGNGYDSSLALIGEYYKNLEDVKFKSIKVYYTLLDEWAFQKEYLPKHEIKIEINELNITNIIFSFESKKEIISSIIINSMNFKNLNEWWEIVILVRNFIVLGLNVPVYPYKLIGIENNKKEIKIYRIANTNFNSYIAQYRHQGSFFKLKDVKDNLSLYLNNLFKKSENLNRFLTNYYSILNNPEIYGEDKFLNFTSILEGYHRYNKINEEMKKGEFKKLKKEILKQGKNCLSDKQIKFINSKIYSFGYEKSLNKRLTELLDTCKILIPIEKSIKKNFVQKIVDTRNTIVHNLKKEILKGEEFSKALYALEVLFVLSVLKEIEFEDDFLKKLLSRFNKFNFLYNDITYLFRI